MIRIIAVGKIKDSHLVSLIEDYKKKINRYHKIEIVEVKDEPIRDNEAEVLKTVVVVKVRSGGKGVGIKRGWQEKTKKKKKQD